MLRRLSRFPAFAAILTLAAPAGAAPGPVESFKKSRCNRCHSVSAAGVGSPCPKPDWADLSDVGLRRPAKDEILEVLTMGSHAPRVDLTSAELDALTAWLVTLTESL